MTIEFGSFFLFDAYTEGSPAVVTAASDGSVHAVYLQVRAHWL